VVSYGLSYKTKTIRFGSGWLSIEIPEKLWVLLSEIAVERWPGNFRILYLLFIDSVLFLIPIFGRLPKKYLLQKDSSKSTKKLGKHLILNDSIILFANAFLDSFVKLYPFLKKSKIISDQF